MVSEEELELHLAQNSLAPTVHTRTKRTEMQSQKYREEMDARDTKEVK